MLQPVGGPDERSRGVQKGRRTQPGAGGARHGTPLPEWEGCLVYEGPSPEDQLTTLCLGIQGPSADLVQEALTMALERVDVAVLKLYEGGPELRERLARVENGVWSDPR